MEPTDHRELGRFRHFQLDDFEADWTKVAEGTLGRVYKVKLKVWRETFAMKQSSNSTYSNRIYRYSGLPACETGLELFLCHFFQGLYDYVRLLCHKKKKSS